MQLALFLTVPRSADVLYCSLSIIVGFRAAVKTGDGKIYATTTKDDFFSGSPCPTPINSQARLSKQDISVPRGSAISADTETHLPRYHIRKSRLVLNTRRGREKSRTSD